MRFLTTLLLCLTAFIAALFTYGNWTWVSVHLWGGLIAEVNLPFLLLLTFLAGLLPAYSYHHAVRWRLRQRLAAAERVINDFRPLGAMAPIAASDPGVTPAVLPAAAPPPADADRTVAAS